ncbi:MAG: sulfatase [Planctomycetaceae bacterium]|nr:sulfatase [Planctomycetaceae bacterium]
MNEHTQRPPQGILRHTRRAALGRMAGGLGTLALASMLDSVGLADGSGTNPLAAKSGHHPARAKRVIFLFMPGGPSHVDLFDPKPLLTQRDGQNQTFVHPISARKRTEKLRRSPFRFTRHGDSGTPVSELFPEIARHVDDMAVINSMHADNINHDGACLQMCTGEQAFARPSVGSWLLHGLGTENQNLPGFVAISPNQPAQGAPLWGHSFLPASFQGTFVQDLENPIRNMGNSRFDLASQRHQLDLLRELNDLHKERNQNESALEARIAAFELAFRMQQRAPAVFDLQHQTSFISRIYGLDDPLTEIFGRQCLMARQLVEQGVRMVLLFHTKSSVASACQLWDHHTNVEPGLVDTCAATDKPIAGLLTDLKQRGLLEDTLVVWSGEFGRTPTSEGETGRGHHPFGFTTWLAGGGVKGGVVHGSTDEFGWHAAEDQVHVHDLHATLLHLMGLDHERLTYRFAGRDFRLTDVSGNVVPELLS